MSADARSRRPGKACGRRGFSLIELMIATVILGIGLVMVATIFPVAVSQTRDAVQKAVVQSVADTAIQTLRVKLRTSHAIALSTGNLIPGSTNLPGDRPHNSAAPNVTGQTQIGEPTGPSIYDSDTSDPPSFPIKPLPTQHPRGFRAIRALNMTRRPRNELDVRFVSLAAPNQILYDSDYEAVFDNNPDPLVGLPSQFIGAGPIYADRSPRVRSLTLFLGAGTYATIDVVDRVYPPIEPSWVADPLNNASSDGNPRYRDLLKAADRRYCWAALGAPGTGAAGPGGPPFELRIFVMFRAELTAQYATQNASLPIFPAVRHARPRPLPSVDDVIFPQPWLVKFDDGVDSTRFHTNYTAESVSMDNVQRAFSVTRLPPGTIICTKEVGELLPAGSIFVDFELGRAHTVLRNMAEPTNPVALRRLILAPDSELIAPSSSPVDGMKVHYPDFPDYAWVIPPPIVRTGGGGLDYYFQGASPVVAVVSATLPRGAG